jgi:hypothetical protein
LSVNSPTFRECWAVRRGGGSVDRLGLRPFVHVEVAELMQDGSLAEDPWEGVREDEWVSGDCCEYGE